MNYNSQKETRPNAATSERVKEEKPIEQTHTSQTQYKAISPKSQGLVSDFLKHGAENAIHARELVRLIGCGTARQLQLLIAQEREQGALIISDTTQGYYLPDTGQKGRYELQRYVASMSSRAASIFKATDGAKAALAVLEGQEHITEAQ